MTRHAKERGSSALEFALLGIPLIFILISVANMALGMMTLHTMQEAVEQGARYAVTHGAGCVSGSNTCSVTVGNIATVISNNAAGIAPGQLNVTLKTNSGATTNCNPVTACTSSGTTWPPSSDNSPGNDIIVMASYTFNPMIAMFWPGGAADSFSITNFNAYTRQRLTF